MTCPVGMPETIREMLWADFKENWREWLKFVFWEIPRDLWRGNGK